MSVQTNQYLMYAVSLPPKQFADKGNEWYDEMFDKFAEDSAYKIEVKHTDGIFWLYDGMSDAYSMIGKVLMKTIEGESLGNPPIKLADLMPDITTKSEIRKSVLKNFGVSGEFDVYLITHYR